jgi:hypothetical protein
LRNLVRLSQKWPWTLPVGVFVRTSADVDTTLGKTNALGHEFYAIVGEANGQAVPMAFAFTASADGTALPGAKDRMLQDFIGWVSERCPNITFTLSDKDTSEINAFHTVIPTAKHQLCYWHALKYLEERLAEDKPPARYDPRKAHRIFEFVDPTWAPGVTSSWLEDGVHESDAEVTCPDREDAPEPHVSDATIPTNEGLTSHDRFPLDQQHVCPPCSS